jgi:hypothetical protein
VVYVLVEKKRDEEKLDDLIKDITKKGGKC